MFRKVISIIFYILGGFFIYMVCLLAFININKVGALNNINNVDAFKFAIIGGFSLPAILFFIVGAAVCRFQNWKSSIGIALLSGVGFNLLVVITFICFLLTPEFKQMMPDNNLAFFNDYFTGFFLMLFLAGLGGFMLITNKRKITEPDV